MMATPSTAKINAQIGNATRELAPGTTWKYNDPGDGYYCLEWLDDPELQPSVKQTQWQKQPSWQQIPPNPNA
jgi:hypothetical protein